MELEPTGVQCGTSARLRAGKKTSDSTERKETMERGRGSAELNYETMAAAAAAARPDRGPRFRRGRKKNQQKKHICISNWADIQKNLLMCALLSRSLSFHLCRLHVSGFYAPPPTLIWFWMICLSLTPVLFPPFLRDALTLITS